MSKNFWQNYSKKARGDGNPFFALAPMADVTDVAFRAIVAKYSRHGQEGGGPDIFWTEFVSADGLCSPGREVLKRDLALTLDEHPIVAQIFGSNPEHMRQAAALCRELGFDGIDINMGCPDKSIEKQGAGACMMKTPDVATAVIRAVKEGAGDLPVSVKTRIGYHREELDTWVRTLLSQNIQALTIHARTRKELSLVPARWEFVKRAVAIRDEMGIDTVILGNGDVMDTEHGIALAKETGCDGIMVGRAIFGNPWLFDRTRAIVSRPIRVPTWIARIIPKKLLRKILGEKKYTISEVPKEERLRVLVEHAELFEKELGDVKNFAIMKKHFKAYVNGFAGAKEVRIRLMEEGNSAREVRKIVEEFLHAGK